MTHLLIYLIKVSACLIVLFSIYYLTIRHFTFHTANRICLIAIITCSFVVPLVQVTSTFRTLPISVRTESDTAPEMEFTATHGYQAPQTNSISSGNMLMAAYILGALLFVYRFAHSLVTLYRHGRQSVVERRQGVRIKRTSGDRSYAFLTTVFVPHGDIDEIIFEHEKTHVQQYHWVDLIVVEVAAIVLWFNPVVYFLKRELRLQHEFLADQSVLNHGVSFERYAQCLIRNIGPQALHNTISPIGSTSIKNRILMMTRKETSCYLLTLYLVMIPAAAFLLMAFGQKSVTDQSAPQLSLTTVVEQTPAISPVDLSKVTNVVKYGDRIHPATKKETKHTGVDFALPLGSDVVSTGDGEVVTQQYGDNEGNYVVVRHDEVFTTKYYHLQKASVKVGDKVKKGQVIGLVGSSGILSSGPHLHYEVVKNGTSVDPKAYLPPVTGL